MYERESTVHWGESDPFGLVYYPRITAWFNDTEHEFFRSIGLAIDAMIKADRTTFVMGEIQFRFIGPAAYGDRVNTAISLDRIGNKTLHWRCNITQAGSGKPIAEGRATRIYARIQEDGTLASRSIPQSMRDILSDRLLNTTAKNTTE